MKLLDVYKVLLPLAGISVDKRNRLRRTYNGKVIKIKKEKVVLPTAKYLDDPDGKVLYHPLNEDITANKSLTIALTERTATSYYNSVAADMLIELIPYMCDQELSDTLTNAQQLLISRLGVAYKTHAKIIEKLLVLAKTRNTSGIVNISVRSVKGRRVATYTSPLLTLLKTEPKSVYGVPVTKKQREMLTGMLEGYFSKGNSEVTTDVVELAPFSRCLFEVCNDALTDALVFPMSGILKSHKDAFELDKPIDLSFFDNRSAFHKVICSVPMIKLNGGSYSKSAPNKIKATVENTVTNKPIVKDVPPWENLPKDTNTLEAKPINTASKAASIQGSRESLFVKRKTTENNVLSQPTTGNEVWRQGYGNTAGNGLWNNTQNNSLISGSNPVVNNTGIFSQNNAWNNNLGNNNILSNQNSYTPFIVKKEPVQTGYPQANNANNDMLSKLLR